MKGHERHGVCSYGKGRVCERAENATLSHTVRRSEFERFVIRPRFHPLTIVPVMKC